MKQNFQSTALLLFLVLLIPSTSHTSARKLAAKEGEADEKINNISSSKEPVVRIDAFAKMMGMEECQNEDEECFKRRVIAEAHLDYIYTQHHKP